MIRQVQEILKESGLVELKKDITERLSEASTSFAEMPCTEASLTAIKDVLSAVLAKVARDHSFSDYPKVCAVAMSQEFDLDGKKVRFPYNRHLMELPEAVVGLLAERYGMGMVDYDKAMFEATDDLEPGRILEVFYYECPQWWMDMLEE